MLNLRIKFYGRLENNLWNHDEVLTEKSFQKVNLKTCLQCHNSGNNFWNRAHISLQQIDTIRFLVDNKQMPPKGFSLSEEERSELHNLLQQ